MRRARLQEHLRRRRAFQARVQDSVNSAINTASVELDCPVCRATVYVPADSDRERVDCHTCRTILRTKQSLAGTVAIEVDDAAMDRLVDALREVGSQHEPEPNWQLRVRSAIEKRPLVLEDFPRVMGFRGPLTVRARVGHGELEYAAGPEAMGGTSGWWWAVAARGVVFACGWAGGGERERDQDVSKAIGELGHLAVQR